MEYQYHRDKTDYFHIGKCNCSEHFHRSIELIYNLEHPKPVTVNGQDYCMNIGELLVVPPLYTHHFPKAERQRSICVVMPVAYSDLFDSRAEGKMPQSLIFSDPVFTKDIYEHLLQLEDCRDPLLKQAIYTYVLAKILRQIVFADADKRGTTDFSARILQYIEQHYAEKLTQDSLAAAFGYNRNYFSALFKKYVHTSFSSYVNVVRINKAIPLLGRYPAAEIAERVGFGNVQSFYQNFKKVTGTTPATYRKKQENV